MRKPRVSIGLPVYNGCNYIAKALDSLLGQSYGDFELIISDNASTDGTSDVCRRYAARDGRIRYYRNSENLGARWNYNRVYELSTGSLFKWFAHDDICAPTLLERCVEVLEQEPSVVLAYPKTVIIDENDNIVSSYDDKLHLVSPSPVVRFKECVLRLAPRCNAVFGLIRSPVLGKTAKIGNYNGSDNILLAQLALIGKFYEIPEDLFYRRFHPGASKIANSKADDLAIWFDPANRGKLVLPYSRWMYEYIKCFMEADIKSRDRICCLMHMGRWFWWHKAKLTKELKTAVRVRRSRATVIN